MVLSVFFAFFRRFCAAFAFASRVSASSSEISRPATGFSPVAARSLAEAAPPIEVPRADLPGAEVLAGIFFGFFDCGAASSGALAISSAHADKLPERGTPSSSAWGDSPNPDVFLSLEAMAAIWG